MQNIQDLKEKIFFESRNIIGILDKISHVDELSSKLDLVEELAERISFLRLLEKNITYFGNENYSPVPENNENFYRSGENDEVTEEEAIFNNELNEIEPGGYSDQVTEEEAIFNNQLNEIVEEELHETLVNFAEENKEADVQEVLNENLGIFNDQPDETDKPEDSDSGIDPIYFSDEERTLAEADSENGSNTNEEIFNEEKTEEEAVFNNQLNEIDEFENEISDNEGEILNSFEEEERILNNFESASQPIEHPAEESSNPPISSNVMMEQGEMATDTSGMENIVNDLRNETAEEERQEESALEETNDRRKIVDIETPVSEEERNSDENSESLEAYHAYNYDKKIKLANIRGLKAVQSFFDENHLTSGQSAEKPASVEKEDTGSILKTNIPDNFMEAEKKKPEFKLDLNDRIAFSKTLFGGSQSELNEVVANLNSFKTLEEAKEYLSDLYYSRKWNKVDEYAQRLWILVENKFL